MYYNLSMKDINKIKLYDKDGWFNAADIYKSDYPIIFSVGGRGIGKTYSICQFLIKNKIPFMYMRRTQEEADHQCKVETSSLSDLFFDHPEWEVEIVKLDKKVSLVHINGEPLIYNTALSTFSSIRGLGFQNYVKVIVYDEFIPEPHVRKFKAEGFALMNMHESVNRNRELKGLPLIRLICLANSLDIANDTFMEFDVISDFEEMSRNDIELKVKGDKLLNCCMHSPISEKKKNTVLYRNASEQFTKMALGNKFILNDFTYVKPKKLIEYNPLLKVGDLYIYRHKSRIEYYVTFKAATIKKNRRYEASIADLERFKRAEWRLFVKYMDGYFFFENYNCVALFERYFK